MRAACMQAFTISRNRGISGVKKYLLKHRDKKDRKLKYDFLPSIIEIVERPANKWGTVIIVFSLFLFVSAFVWAYFAKMDTIVSVPGMVNAKEEIAKVESMAGGQVSHIAVKEGDYVEKGSVLVELDTHFIDDAIANLEYQLEILNLQKDIYDMLADGEDITKLNSEDYGEHKWIVKALVEEEKLFKATVDEYERQKALGVEVEYLQYEKENYELSRKSEIASMLSQCELQIWQYEEDLKTYKDNLEFYTIRANKSGYINNLQVLSEEEVVSAGDLIACIVDKEELVVECYVPDYERANIELGQKVNVKIHAYPYNDYGMFEGEIVKISDIAVQDESYGNVYVADVTVKNMNDLTFNIGMSGTAEVVTGNRSVLEYFLEPLKEGFENSFKEK